MKGICRKNIVGKIMCFTYGTGVGGYTIKLWYSRLVLVISDRNRVYISLSNMFIPRKSKILSGEYDSSIESEDLRGGELVEYEDKHL